MACIASVIFNARVDTVSTLLIIANIHRRILSLSRNVTEVNSAVSHHLKGSKNTHSIDAMAFTAHVQHSARVGRVTWRIRCALISGSQIKNAIILIKCQCAIQSITMITKRASTISQIGVMANTAVVILTAKVAIVTYPF